MANSTQEVLIVDEVAQVEIHVEWARKVRKTTLTVSRSLSENHSGIEVDPRKWIYQMSLAIEQRLGIENVSAPVVDYNAAVIGGMLVREKLSPLIGEDLLNAMGVYSLINTIHHSNGNPSWAISLFEHPEIMQNTAFLIAPAMP